MKFTLSTSGSLANNEDFDFDGREFNFFSSLFWSVDCQQSTDDLPNTQPVAQSPSRDSNQDA
jgi:hypothetical protein